MGWTATMTTWTMMTSNMTIRVPTKRTIQTKVLLVVPIPVNIQDHNLGISVVPIARTRLGEATMNRLTAVTRGHIVVTPTTVVPSIPTRNQVEVITPIPPEVLIDPVRSVIVGVEATVDPTPLTEAKRIFPMNKVDEVRFPIHSVHTPIPLEDGVLTTREEKVQGEVAWIHGVVVDPAIRGTDPYPNLTGVPNGH